MLRARSLEAGGGGGYTFLADGEEAAAELSFSGLDARARAIAAALQRSGATGERVVLLYPSGLEFVAAFFGCLYAGSIAVPIYLPKSKRSLLRLRTVSEDVLPRAILTSTPLLPRVEEARREIPCLQGSECLATDALPAGLAAEWRDPEVRHDSVALLQYTSGSTSSPRGVVLRHSNLLHNEECIRQAFGQSPESVIVTWLPLYHDMGLIGGVLQPLYVGGRCILMSPGAFLQKPLRWLEAVSRYRATTSGGPNFAYDLCVRRIAESDRARLDLSSWELAFNGAEPVRAETLERFAAAFGPCGFRLEAFYPCYGLAEATLFVTGGQRGQAPGVETFDAAELAEHSAVAVAPEAPGAKPLVSCGHPWADQRVVIVDPETGRECPPGRVGEIRVEGESVAFGYWNRPESEAFRNVSAPSPAAGGSRSVRTGDLGFLFGGGELFVTGRLKELILIRGRCHYPQDLERTAERSQPALRPGGGAAFSIEVGGEERLVLVHEVARHPGADLGDVAAAIRGAIAEEHELQTYEVVLVKAGTLPKTSSGKNQRGVCRDLYLQGRLAVEARSGGLDPDVPEDGESAGDDLPGGFAALQALPPEERLGALLPWLRGEVARHIGVPSEKLAEGEPLIRMGLDSLSAVELQESLERTCGTSLPWTTLLQGADLAALGRELLAGLNAPADLHPSGTRSPGAEPDSPLSYGQKALWVLHRLAPKSSAYHIAAAARVMPPLDDAAFRRALCALAERHPMLRATFHQVEGGPRQRAGAGLEPEVFAADASGWSEEELEERMQREANRPFDLGSGPLVRAAIWRRSPGEDRLLLGVHHIVSDFWALALLTRELSALYAAESSGVAFRLPPVSSSYADHVQEERERLAGPEGERLREYWRKRLQGPLPVLDLPTDRPRPPVQSYAGGCASSRPGSPLFQRAAEVARASGATLSSALLAAFTALLQRYTALEDVIVGIPTAGRAALATTAGYFVNPVVLRADLSGEPGFASLVERIQQAALEAFEHQEYPFAVLAETLQIDRDPSRSPLFQVMFTRLGTKRPEESALVALALREGGERMGFGGHVLESVSWQERTSQLDLNLRAGEVGGSLVLSLQYNSDLFDAATIGRMLGHLETLLEAAVADPGRSSVDLPLLASEERDQILLGWSGALRGRPAGACCLHELFESSAVRTPEAPAVIEGDRSWTYDELNRRANQLAHHLRRLGVWPEQRVGVLMGRSCEIVASLLGVLKAGAAYVPLDPAYPAGWLSFAAEDAKLALVLTEARLGGKLAGWPEVDVASGIIAFEPEHNPEPLAGPGNLAYVMYTSGSTGRPKGVAIEHRAPVERMCWARAAFPPETLAGVLASTSICFDLSVFEIFAPLSWGGTVILAENALALPRLSAAREVRLANTVPSAMAELASAGLPPALRTVCLAGEALSPQLVDRIYRHAGVEEVLNLYGPTEDATYSTWARIERGGSRVTIGRPLPGTRAYVLDRRLEPVPGGVPGMLFLAGAGAARGYLGQPDLTAERFLPDPLGTDPGSRLYRTGDLARWLATGELELLGRLDHQVKVRGFRIELEEIERVLREHPQIREAAVVVRDSPAGERSLAAYVAPEEAGVPELGRYLRERLPAYMVPSSFQLLPGLPRTLNGKIDRRALPAGAGEREAFVAPRTPTEELVAEVWADVLAAPRVSAADNFFHLGGHSLLAVRAATRLQSLLGVPVSLQQILQSPTVSELAGQIDAQAMAGRGLALPPLRRAPRPPRLPLSFAQERLWFLAQLEPDSPAYHMAAALELQGALRVDLLGAAFAELVRRHEALRTSFPQAEGRPVQEVAPFAGQPLPVVDLEALPAACRQEEVRRVATEEGRRPFDLGQGPLLRVFLLRTAAREHVLSLTLHHIVSDGWALGVLAREVTAAYSAFARGERPGGPGLPVQYADFALWQRSWLAGGEMERQLGYWSQTLEGAPAALELPTDRPRPPVRTFRGAKRSVRLAPGPSAALAALGRREGATPFMALLASSAVLLGRWARQEDFVLGAPIANRSWAEIENLVGLFANTLALRLRLAAEAGFDALLSAVRQSALAAYSHQDLPFEKLVDDLQIARLPGRSPLFQVLAGLWNAPLGELNLPGVAASRMEIETGAAKLDLTLRFEIDERGIGVQAEYASDLFEAVTIERLLSHFQVLVAGAVAAPERSFADLPLIGPEELHQLLCEWNDTERHGAAPACLHDLFERQALRSPEALAVEAGEERLTWHQLRGRSNRLAWSLRRQGVGLESRVGVFLPRSVDQIVAILGVLKAGGAYVPLDPASPPERLHLILEEAGVSVVVTAESLRSLLPSGCAAVLPPMEEGPEPPAWQGSPPPPVAGPENLAYVLYTSGSTGRPKGVMVEHRSVVNLLAALRETVYRGAAAPLRVAVNAPLVFDASVKQWIQLLDGHSLHIVPEEVRPDAERMLRLLRDREVQVLDCTPGQLSYLLAAGLLHNPGPVERVLVGGEEVPRSDWSLLRASERPRFYNVYGPTECTVDTTAEEVRGGLPVLGRPLANVRVHLLDPALNPVPPGTPGELCVGGAGVARGYVRLPAQTAERFVPDPWAPEPGARLYRTGDLARRLADGTLEFLGRVDRQVKVHGFRIELGEIEAVLGQCSGVLAAAVLVRTDELGQRRLVAYVACPGEGKPGAGDLRSYLKRKLPDYMVPSGLKVLAELPRTSNGKIDRAALAALDGQAEERQAAAEPNTPLEKVLAGMVAEVLGLDRVGLYDNFFELGGHSMRAVELVSALREAFGIDLPLFHVFDSPTVAGLSAVLLESPEWRQTVEELAPALLQFAEPRAEPAGGLAQDGEG